MNKIEDRKISTVGGPSKEAGMHKINQEEEILRAARTVAVVGVSPDAERPSYGVFSYLSEGTGLSGDTGEPTVC